MLAKKSHIVTKSTFLTINICHNVKIGVLNGRILQVLDI